ncbi:MAG TPA: hypothetical protein VGJ79_02970 [Candidatus Dormibacteraeota bacterium]
MSARGPISEDGLAAARVKGTPLLEPARQDNLRIAVRDQKRACRRSEGNHSSVTRRPAPDGDIPGCANRPATSSRLGIATHTVQRHVRHVVE